jgi:mono/diheme cytochrome c family protein
VKLRVPLLAKLGALVVATTGFYTYVGQMVPQKEVYPPKETLIKADITTAEMVTIGKEIFEGKGLCTTCHTIGKKTGPYRFPDLENVAVRAKTREAGMSDVDYFAQTLYEPDKFIVPGFNSGMPTINKPPIGLTNQEILCVMAYLQSLGGTPSVTLQTTHQYNGGAAAVVAEGAAKP